MYLHRVFHLSVIVLTELVTIQHGKGSRGAKPVILKYNSMAPNIISCFVAVAAISLSCSSRFVTAMVFWCNFTISVPSM